MPPSSKKKSPGTITVASHSEMPNPLLDHNVVFLFIPNIIGYTRVLLAASSLYFMRWHPKYCTWLYIVSCLLDAFDGMAARRFNQSHIPSPSSRNHPIPCPGSPSVLPICLPSGCPFLCTLSSRILMVASKFGAVLDMVTDRCTTACLLCYLCSAYPQYTFWFQGIISVDLASHYMHMYR